MQICENGAVVPNPEANPGLVRDCAYLLTAEDALAGVATLDWGAGTPIGEWEGGTPGRVRKLELASRGLSGRIPAELGGLTELRSLRLQRNRLSGAIPRALGAPGTLASLDLSHNQLSGAIPEQLGALQDLWFLSLEGNELTGAIPATLGALSSLGRLRLSDNQLSGAIPASLGDLSALWMLRLNGNALTGPVPESLGALPTLWELRLDDNQLRGAIAQALGSASNLRLLYLDGNAGLTGCIPAALRTVRHSDLADLGLADCADPAPLTLTLSGGREQCTAGTLSRAGWSIAGGVAPYTLTVAGEAVDRGRRRRGRDLRGPAGGWERDTGDDHGARDGRHRRDDDGERGIHDRGAAAGADWNRGLCAAHVHRDRLEARSGGRPSAGVRRLSLPAIPPALAGRRHGCLVDRAHAGSDFEFRTDAGRQ